MNYTILVITALILAIVAVAALFREISKSNKAHRKQACDIGEEACRLLMKEHYGKTHTSKLAGTHHAKF